MMNPNVNMQPTIILLKDGTDASFGRGQLISNINACQAIVETVRTTLGPCGMDKMIIDGSGKVTISNDGATIMKLLDIVHPAAKTLVDIARSQDAEIGDGTTTVVLLAGELLKASKSFIEEGVHPQIIIKGFRRAQYAAVEQLRKLAISVDRDDSSGRRALLEKCAKTSLNSKLISRYQDFFAPMVVDAVESLGEDLDMSMIGIKKVPGGSVTDSFLVQGVAFKKTFAYAGFEQQPKSFENPKILLLNLELELKSEKDNAEIRIDDVKQYQKIVDAEWDIIYEKLAKCVESGAQIILSKLPIGDLATQYFADRGLFCAGRVASDDLQRVAKATGARVQTTVNGLDKDSDVLGTCAAFNERQVGADRYNFLTGCPHANTATLVLRGGAKEFIEESERSLHDSMMIVKNCVKSTSIIAGGGAVEMTVSKSLKDLSRTIAVKEQLIVAAFARALEVTPYQLSDNAGFDSTEILNRLRQKHAQPDGTWWGVDIRDEGICNTLDRGVWEPVNSKINSLSAATEAACMILSIDETVRNPQSEQPGAAPGARGGMGRGKPLSAALGGGGMRGMMRGRPGIRAYQGRSGK
jgi:T-complex protein 1 subunit eta